MKDRTENRDNRCRTVIEHVSPEIDGGLHPIKKVVGEKIDVYASIFADGHDRISARVLYRKIGSEAWSEVPFEKLPNDRWRAAFYVKDQGWYEYTVSAWIDRFAGWQENLRKRVDAGQDPKVDLLIGAGYVEEAADTAAANEACDSDVLYLKRAAESLGGKKGSLLPGATGIIEGENCGDEKSIDKRLSDALDPVLKDLMTRHSPRHFASFYKKRLKVLVERKRAVFSSWYEMFPRSASTEAGTHGTFRDVEARLPYVAEMGFDILYLPPIHPVGRQFRKGRNNSINAEPDDIGSPWAIGGPEGGHKSVHPDLGTLEDFRRLVQKAAEYGIETALDIAFQCSPDHPYVREHPDWFLARPDGTIQYAENPPKKYQDIYPFNFECDDWRNLWRELTGIFLFWAGQGVKVFRVDNPHTKPFVFWEWCIEQVKRRYPQTIFLSEAFTRPHPMYKLAKLGFTQSYTYFAWKNTKQEIEEWWKETVFEEPRHYYRPNLWPNTPDILNAFLQEGGKAAFRARFILAATMGASYGIYGPCFELMENVPREPGSEEYLDSEKYQLRHWDIDREDSLKDLISLVNRIRKDHPALQTNEYFRFHSTDNENIICYSKRTADFSDVILVVVNLDPKNTQSGWLDLDTVELGMSREIAYRVHDLLSGASYSWQGPKNFVSLKPMDSAHILLVEGRV